MAYHINRNWFKHLTTWNIVAVVCVLVFGEAVFGAMAVDVVRGVAFLVAIVGIGVPMVYGVDKAYSVFKTMKSFSRGDVVMHLYNAALHVLPAAILGLPKRGIAIACFVFLGWYLVFRNDMREIYTTAFGIKDYDMIVMAVVVVGLVVIYFRNKTSTTTTTNMHTTNFDHHQQ